MNPPKSPFRKGGLRGILLGVVFFTSPQRIVEGEEHLQQHEGA
jgi:hypothetical protein